MPAEMWSQFETFYGDAALEFDPLGRDAFGKNLHGRVMTGWTGTISGGGRVRQAGAGHAA
jgi:hypothetical protein